jgi:predicted nuclease of predicted toxin-antitoxin system
VRLLADKSCDFAVVRALREAGHDVMAIIETASGSTDEEVADLAAHEDRILITEDRDFVVSAVTSLGNRFGRRFVVVQPGRVRSESSTDHPLQLPSSISVERPSPRPGA